MACHLFRPGKNPRQWRLVAKSDTYILLWNLNQMRQSSFKSKHLDVSSTHYNGVIMGVITSQIASLTIIYSSIYSGADQWKHQSSASLAFVRGIHWWPVNSPHKGPVMRIMFLFDDVILKLSTDLFWLEGVKTHWALQGSPEKSQVSNMSVIWCPSSSAKSGIQHEWTIHLYGFI